MSKVVQIYNIEKDAKGSPFTVCIDETTKRVAKDLEGIVFWCDICMRGSLVSWCPACNPIAKTAILAPPATATQKAVEELPDKIKEVTVSGVAVPRQELDKISLQDLRIVIDELTNLNREEE